MLIHHYSIEVDINDCLKYTRRKRHLEVSAVSPSSSNWLSLQAYILNFYCNISDYVWGRISDILANGTAQ